MISGSARRLRDVERPFVTVTTGVPRSGTSLVMQMLAAGGMRVTSDGVRPPDESNPQGYYESEAVKALGRGEDLRPQLREMVGTAVKIVAPLVLRLPSGFAYRVLLVRRDIGEIIESQRLMMSRLGVPARGDDALLARGILSTWNQVRIWATTHSRTTILELNYADLIADPRAASAAVNAFLGGGLDVVGSTTAVDPALYRCRKTAGKSRDTGLSPQGGARLTTL